MSTATVTETTTTHAEQVWAVMAREARQRGMALIKDKTYGDGRMLVGRVAAFVVALNDEREWELDTDQITAVIGDLARTGNVVTQDAIEGDRHRIFVAEAFDPRPLVDLAAPVAPVTYRCADCGAAYTSQSALNGHRGATHRANEPPVPRPTQGRGQSLTVHQRSALAALAAQPGGEIRDEGGMAVVAWANAAGVTRGQMSSLQRALVRRKLVRREGNRTRTYRYAITREGERILQRTKPTPAGPATEGTSPGADEVTPAAMEGMATQLANVPDALLLVLLNDRLAARHRTSDAVAKLDAVRTIIGEVNEGKYLPLAALGAIERIVS